MESAYRAKNYYVKNTDRLHNTVKIHLGTITTSVRRQINEGQTSRGISCPKIIPKDGESPVAYNKNNEARKRKNLKPPGVSKETVYFYKLLI